MKKENGYSKENQILISRISSLIDNQKYDVAEKEIEAKLAKIKNGKSKEEILLTVELGGFLIDIGEEGKREKSAIKGLNILKRKKNDIKGVVWEASYHYNIGNAYDSIFKIKLFHQDLEYKQKNIGLLNEAKNAFWKAYQINLSTPDIKLKPYIAVNLANALDKSARVVEALQFYDIVLKEYPNFAKALANRAKALIWLAGLSGSSSANLIYQAAISFRKASKDKKIPKWLQRQFKQEATKLDNYLSNNIDTKKYNFEHESKEIEEEFKSHSTYRKFCLINNLTLSEHALYCHCLGARRDDLMIATPSFPIMGEFVPIMEHYLNRIKSEFTASRLLFYRSLTNDHKDWEVFQNEVVYTELFENEIIDINSEMLRSSYRLCFGILDKIAEAVCELYDLAHENENIYFESFWNPRGKRLNTKQQERWEKINSIQNSSLIALYSQACDLNRRSGEWNIFKSWRNSLEHGIFVITNDEYSDPDPFKIFDKKRKIASTNYSDFLYKTLHLLRFTRSAIFNFVFLVRREGYNRTDTTQTKGGRITLNFKK